MKKIQKMWKTCKINVKTCKTTVKKCVSKPEAVKHMQNKM